MSFNPQKNYRMIQSSNYDCLICCLEMIINSISNCGDKKNLRDYLDVYVDLDDPYKNGVIVDISVINGILGKYNLNYKARYELASHFEEWIIEQKVRDSLDSKSHIIVTLNTSFLYDVDQKDSGHAVIVYGYKDKDYIVLDTDTMEIYSIAFEKLYLASRKRSGGFLIIEEC